MRGNSEDALTCDRLQTKKDPPMKTGAKAKNVFKRASKTTGLVRTWGGGLVGG